MLPGITTFLAVGILLGIAYRRYSLHSSDPWILVCLMLAGLALRLYEGTGHPNETMFHIDRIVVYEQVPEEAVLDSLRAVGYVVYRELKGQLIRER